MARDALGQPHTGVSLFTWNPELLAQVTDRRVIAVHTPPALGSGIRLYVGNDDYKLGRMLGQQLEPMIPPGMQVSSAPARHRRSVPRAWPTSWSPTRPPICGRSRTCRAH